MLSFSIITPTIQRPSLVQCCRSVDAQTYPHWEHVVRIDRHPLNEELVARTAHPQRRVTACDREHRNWGNTCRHQAWELATGEWVWYLDDDNLLADNNILEDLAVSLADVTEPWVVVPIMRHGQRFFSETPGNCHIDTMNMILRREVARWPDIDDYTADGFLCDSLVVRYPYRTLPQMRPIGIMEHSNCGM